MRATHEIELRNGKKVFVETVPAGKVHPNSGSHGKSRYVVNGINHPSGIPIKFHSLMSIKNYFINQR